MFPVDGTFRETAFLAGRIVSATAGTISVFITYLIARRLYRQQFAVLAAFLLAAFPLHITCSRYLKEDALLVMFILLCAWLVIKAAQDGKRRYLLLAGFIAGVASGTKYSGLLLGAVVCIAPWLRSGSLRPDWQFLKTACFALALMPLGFLLTTPYSLLDFNHFWRDFNSERHHMLRGHTANIDPWSQLWMYQLWYSIRPGISLFVTVISLVGAGVIIVRKKVYEYYLLFIILLFYLPAEFVNAKPAPQPERYIMPILPFMALCTASLVVFLNNKKMKMMAVTVTFLTIITPTWWSLKLTSEVVRDTRATMLSWINENIPPGSRIAIDWKPYEPKLDSRRFKVTYLPREKILAKLNPRSLSESGQNYLLLSSLWYSRYFIQPNADKAGRSILRQAFKTLPILKITAPEYGTYGFHNPVILLFSVSSGYGVEEANLSKAKRAGLHEKCYCKPFAR